MKASQANISVQHFNGNFTTGLAKMAPPNYVDRIHRALLFIGIIELVASLCVIGCGVASVVFKSRFYHFGHGIWAGMIFAMAAASAVAAGFSKSRGYLASHITTCIVACVFTLPGLTTLLFLERISDKKYTYWTDPSECRIGCAYSSSDEVHEWRHLEEESIIASNIPSDCDNVEWKSTCHPNHVALGLEMAMLTILVCLASMFVLSSSLTCCILCRCRVGRDEVFPIPQSESIIVYTTYAGPNHHAYYGHGNVTWAIPYSHPELIMHYNRQQNAASTLPPPSYDETQREAQLRQQLHLQSVNNLNDAAAK